MRHIQWGHGVLDTVRTLWERVGHMLWGHGTFCRVIVHETHSVGTVYGTHYVRSRCVGQCVYETFFGYMVCVGHNKCGDMVYGILWRYGVHRTHSVRSWCMGRIL